MPRRTASRASHSWATALAGRLLRPTRRRNRIHASSGGCSGWTGPDARRLVSEGKGDDLLCLPGRSFPSFISAATYLDQVDTPRAYLDIFGMAGTDAAISKITCPLLAFFGTSGDVGGEAELTAVRATGRRLATGPRRIDTAMIARADHMYAGEEAQVAQVIADWLDRAVLPSEGAAPGPAR